MMDLVVCPKCGTENPANAMNCKNCRINLRFALEHPDEIERTKREEESKNPSVKLVRILKDSGLPSESVAEIVDAIKNYADSLKRS